MMKSKKSNKTKSFPDFETVKDIVIYGAVNGADKKQFMYTDLNRNVATKTFAEVWYDASGMGQYLYSKGMRNKKVAILGENSYYWIACYYAMVTGRIVAVPLDPKLPADDLADILIRSGCEGLVYSDDFAREIELFKQNAEVPVKEYIRMDDVENIAKLGHAQVENGAENYLDDEVLPDDLAFIVYTSGTTGKSKGVMLTQNNVAADVTATCRVMYAENFIAFLPFHHCFSWGSALFASCVFTEWGYICPSLRTLENDIKDYHPQNFSAVPLAVETIYKKIWYTAKKQGKEEILKKGLKISKLLMKFGIDIRRKIFKEVIDNLGGNLELIICGGAYLDPKYEQGLTDLGIQIINGYGISECSPIVTVNRIDNCKFGSAGLPIPCNEVKINEPNSDGVGEIYVRGSNVMKGYYNDPEATAEAFDGEWFKTGDFGRLDEDGFLFFVGRKKNLIVLSNGKNVSPEELEDKLVSIDYVKEVVVYGENDLITAEFFLDTNMEPDAKQKIKADVNELNKKLPGYKRINKIKTRDTEFPKTTTLKIRRNYKN